MDRHSDAIKLIEKEVADIEIQLSAVGGDEVLVLRKESLVKSLRLLQQLTEYDVAPRAKIHTLPLPESSGHFSEFRLLDDQETEDRNHWTSWRLKVIPSEPSWVIFSS